MIVILDNKTNPSPFKKKLNKVKDINKILAFCQLYLYLRIMVVLFV